MVPVLRGILWLKNRPAGRVSKFSENQKFPQAKYNSTPLLCERFYVTLILRLPSAKSQPSTRGPRPPLAKSSNGTNGYTGY